MAKVRTASPGGPATRAPAARRASPSKRAPAGADYVPQRAYTQASGAAGVAQRLIVDRFSPAAVLVDRKVLALYFCGPTERFLLQPRGAPTQDLLALLRAGLRAQVRSALREAEAARVSVVVAHGRVKRGGVFEPVRITVTPLGLADDPGRTALIVFEDEPGVAGGRGRTAAALTTLVKQLEEELRVTREDLQNTIERLAGSSEELKASNDAIIAFNEQLQSSNEELSTVNQQLQGKLAELETTSHDLNNLLESRDIATVCLDSDLRIKRFSSGMHEAFKFLPADIGRPIADLTPALLGRGVLADAQTALRKRTLVQREIESETGRWYLRRVFSYPGGNGRGDRVVVSYTDISDARRSALEDIEKRAKLTQALEERVVQRTTELRRVVFELAMAEERERRTIAAELHDGITQLLAVASMKLAGVKQDTGPAVRAGALEEVEGLVKDAEAAARALIFQLSPPMLHELGMDAAVQWLAEEMHRVYGLAVEAHTEDGPPQLDMPVRTLLFRVVRELLINVAKHARTDRAELDMHASDNELLIRIVDYGVGFDQVKIDNSAESGAARTGGFGLLSVRERISFVGGRFEIESEPGDGTAVTIMVPLAAAVSKTPAAPAA